MGHGRIWAGCVFKSGGLAIATIAATNIAATSVRILATATVPSPAKFTCGREAVKFTCDREAVKFTCDREAVKFTCDREAVNQQGTPISIIESPRMFNTSTRSRSLHGDNG